MARLLCMAETGQVSRPTSGAYLRGIFCLKKALDTSHRWVASAQGELAEGVEIIVTLTLPFKE